MPIHRDALICRLFVASAIVVAAAWGAARELAGDDAADGHADTLRARVEEVRPELFYLQSGSGGLVPVPGFRYEDFIDMLRLKDGLPRGPQPPPVLLTSVGFAGVIDGSVCEATVELRATQTEAGWVSVPLALSSMRFTESPVHEGPGRFVIEVDPEAAPGDRPRGYRAWFDGPANGEHVLRLKGTLPVERSAAREAIAIDLPRATASRATVVTQLDDPVVGVSPEVAEPRVEPVAATGGGSRVVLVGVAGPVRIRLSAAGTASQVAGAAPQAVGEVVVRVDGRRAVSDVTLTLGSLAADVRSVRVRLPRLATVTRVDPPAALAEAGGTASDPEALFNIERSPSGEAVVRFECETPVDASGGTPLEALAFRVDGIPDWRQWGRVSVVVAGDWQVGWGTAAGSRRVDPPKALEGNGCVGAFAYDAQPATLPIRVTPLGSRVVVEPEYRYAVSGSRIELEARLRVSVRGAPVSAIELQLEGWGIDEVGPSNLVETSGLTGESGRLTIPFVKPLSGNATVELRAARAIARGDERVRWTLPVPKADLVGPAVVEIVSDRDIELVPEPDRIKGLVRQVAPASASRDASSPSPGSRDAQVLAYRLDGTAGTFEAIRRFLPRRVDASITARIVVDRSDIVVDETLRFDVAHLALETLVLSVPRGIFESGGFEVRQNDQLLTPIEDRRPVAADTAEEEPGARDEPVADAATRPLSLAVPLASPLLGTGELKLRYSVKTPHVPEEASVPENLPLVLPVDVRIARQSFAVESQAGIAVDLRGEQWKRDTAAQTGLATRSWSAAKPQEEVPLVLSTERQTASAGAIVEAAWLETRLLPERREDLFRYRIETAAPSISVTLPASSLPPGSSAGAIEVRLDGKSVAGEVQPGGRLVVDLSGGGGSGGYLLEIDRVLPRPNLLEPLVLEAPQFGERTVQRRFYWEVRLESNDHVVVPPGRWTSQQRWGWSALGPERQPIVSRESLVRWLAGGLPARVAATGSQPSPPLAERRAVYSGVGWPGRERAWLAPTWLVVLGVSGPVLLAGLLAVYRPAVRNAPMAVATAVALVAVSVLVPDQIPLVAQGAVPGLTLVLLAAALRAMLHRPPQRRVMERSGSVIISGASTRTVSPASVVIASGSRPEAGSIVRLVLFAIVASSAAAGTAADATDGPSPAEHDALRFLRMHVPRAAITPEMLGAGRYVPMPANEFDAAMARLTHRASPEVGRTRRVVRSSYRLSWEPGRGLCGSLEFDIGSAFADPPFAIRVGGAAASGRCRVSQALVESAEGTGAATVAGLPDGDTVVLVRERGTYRCTWHLDPAVEPAASGGLAGNDEPQVERFSMPLMPALSTSVQVSVPAGYRPVVDGAWARAVDDPADERGASHRTYRFELGPRDEVGLKFMPTTASAVPLAVVNRVAVAKRAFAVAAEVRPRRPWDAKSFIVELDPGLAVTDVAMVGRDGDSAPLSWSLSTGRTVQVILPERCSGRDSAVLVSAIAALGRPEGMQVPIVRPLREAWAGGRVVVVLDETTTFTSIAAEDGVIVDPDAAMESDRPTVAMEQQSSRANLRISVAPRTPDLDVARMTTVDISGGAVTARTAANVVVRRGEAFELEGVVAAGWIIDGVELVGRQQVPEWGIETAATGNVLKIGLVEGVTPGPGLDVKIVGHRPALPQERGFPSTELDMIRFRGESQGQAIMDLRADAETTLLFGGLAEASLPSSDMQERLRRLSETGSPRARIPAGVAESPREITILRRRPPVDARTQIRLTVRDDRLSESFTFECAPRTAELDSLVVHFSEPTGDQLEWSVLAPGNVKVSARRLEADRAGRGGTAQRGDAAANATPIGEAWLVEIAPPVRETITLRASRSGPFREPRRACLAWVEGSPVRIGEVFVRDAGRIRPTITDCRLPELPMPQTAPDRASAVASFGFEVDRDLRGDGEPPFVLEPGSDDPADARAWAWSENTTVWCHESGAAEYEARFLIENHGRRSAILELPADKRLESVRIDDVRLDVAGGEAGGIQLPIDLPPGRRFVQLDVRLVAERKPRVGIWSVDASAGRLDMPVMERAWNVALPPSLEIARDSAAHRRVGDGSRGWAERLLGFRLHAGGTPSAGPPDRGDADAEAGPVTDPGTEGFRTLRFVPADNRSSSGSVTLVRRSLVARAAILAGAIAAAAGLVFSRRQPAVVVVMIAACGLVALWAPSPWQEFARASLWGSLTAGLLAGGAIFWKRFRERVGFRPPLPMAPLSAVGTAIIVFAVGLPAGALGDDALPSFRVFLTPGDSGDVALVPEPLFRVMAAADEGRKASVPGVISARVLARPAGSDAAADPNPPWTIELGVEGRAGEVFAFDQGDVGGRFVVGSATLDGRAIPDAWDEAGRMLRLPLPNFGRHQIRVEVIPRRGLRGGIAEATIGMPSAARAELVVAGAAAFPVRGIQECEWTPSVRESSPAWRFAERLGTDQSTALSFDVTTAAAVRLIRPTSDNGAIAREPTKVACRNDIAWGDDATDDGIAGAARRDHDRCVVTLKLVVEPTDQDEPGSETIVPAVWIDADPRLVPPDEAVATEAGVKLEAFGTGRMRLAWLSPKPGRQTVVLPFVMPLDPPVGVFEVPTVRPASLLRSAARTFDVRLRTGPRFRVKADLPQSATPIQPGQQDVAGRFVGWSIGRSDVPVAVSVTRRDSPLVGSQDVAVGFEADRVRLALRARIDSAAAALPELRVAVPKGCLIDGVCLFAADAAGGAAAPLDVRYGRERDATVVIVPQAPRSGRFRLEVDARLPGPPAAQGTFPIARVEALPSPLGVHWTGSESATVRVDGVDGRENAVFDLPAEVAAPGYRIGGEKKNVEDPRRSDAADVAVSDDGTASQAPQPDTRRARVDLADIRLAIDDRGKAWGVVRFELLADSPLVRVRLPRATRLFEAFVDDHAVSARPADESSWEITLLDISRPRSVVVVFAGDLGDRVASGTAVELPPPEVESMPARDVLWTIRGPRDRMVRLLPVSQAASQADLRSLRRTAIERLTPDVVQGFGMRNPEEQAKIRGFLERDGSQEEFSPEWLWGRSSRGLAPDSFFAAHGGDAAVRFRVARAVDASLPGRILATSLLLTMGAVAWRLSRRQFRPGIGSQKP